MVEEKIYTSAEALKKGYLEDKVVHLKPIPSKGSNMITDKSHVGYFMWEGAKKMFVLPTDKYNVLVSPFKNEEEAHYFSKLLDLDLNPRKKEDNFWHTFKVVVTKTPEFMHTGIKLNLADPMDNIRYRVLCLQPEIAKTWDERFEHPAYNFAFVESDYEEKTENAEMKRLEEVFTFWGTIKESPEKMRDFLAIYTMEKRIDKLVTPNDTKEFLVSEIQKLIKNDLGTVHKLSQDEDLFIKSMIYRLTLTGAIRRKGVHTYVIVGTDEKDLSYGDLIKELKFLKETTDPLYLKLQAQLNTKK